MANSSLKMLADTVGWFTYLTVVGAFNPGLFFESVRQSARPGRRGDNVSDITAYRARAETPEAAKPDGPDKSDTSRAA
jgi:hypothetical protein